MRTYCQLPCVVVDAFCAGAEGLSVYLPSIRRSAPIVVICTSPFRPDMVTSTIMSFGCCGAVRGVRRPHLAATAFTETAPYTPTHPPPTHPKHLTHHVHKIRTHARTHSTHGTHRIHGTHGTHAHAVCTPCQDTEEEVEPKGEAKGASLEIVETASVPKRLSRAWSLRGRRALSRGPEASVTSGPAKPSPQLEEPPAAPEGPRVSAPGVSGSEASGPGVSGPVVSGPGAPAPAPPSAEEHSQGTTPTEDSQDAASMELSQSWMTAPMEEEELSQDSNSQDSDNSGGIPSLGGGSPLFRVRVDPTPGHGGQASNNSDSEAAQHRL